MAAKKPSVSASKDALTKRARALTKKVKSTAKQLKTATAPPKRKRATDNSAQLKKYANLAKNGTSRKVKADAKRRKKAEYLATLPKDPVKRLLYRLNPRRAAKYWFSREGAMMALKIAGIGFAVGTIFLIAIFAFFRRDLPDPRDLAFEEATRFYDRTGETLLYTVYGEENRTIVEFDQISEHVKNATIALEDKNFYHHNGFSVSGIMRAAINNVMNRDATGQGGSTITQQFIKNSLVGDDDTYTRKVKELILSIELERLYSKDEILAFYLNEIPYGALEYGIESAARGFFDKTAKELSIDEAAMLAALPQAPSLYSPYGGDTDALTARQEFTIDQMVGQGFITAEEAQEAKDVDTLKKIIPIENRSQYKDIKAPHFVLNIQKQLEEEYGETTLKKGGLKIITTLDLKAQKMAEKAVNDRYKQGGAMGDNAALVAVDVPTGQVIAYVGSKGFNVKGYGAFDAATPAVGRQPGSSFKPYAYAEMFKNERWSPGSIIWDSATNFNGYAPHDFDFRFPGPMKVRDAVGRSRNIPAIKALYIAGIDNTIDLAQSMGVKSLCDTCDYGLSLVLGSGEVKLSEHVQGFSTFARDGTYKEQAYILKIENPDGTVLEEWKDDEGTQVLDPQIAYLMQDILTDDVARSATFGLGSNLVIPGYTVAAKTGTTDLSVDGWLMGFSQYVAAGVWVGNHDSEPMHTFVEPMVGPIWHQFMADYHKGKEDKKFERPEGIKNVRIDRTTGRNATNSSKSVINDIAASWFKGVEATAGSEVTIDTVSNKLATNCTPERAKKKVNDAGIAPELPPDDPFFAAWAKGAGYSASGSSIKEKDNVHKCSDQKPTVSLSDEGGGTVKATYTQGTHKLKTLNFKVGGQIVSSSQISGNGSKTYTHSSGGKITAEVIDEALYDATSNEIEVTGNSLAILEAIYQSGETRFKWSGHTSRVTIYRASNNSFICDGNNNNDDDCDVNSNLTGQSVYAKDEDGHTSATVTVEN